MQMITFLVLAADSSHWSGQLLADTALLLTTSQGPRQSRLQLCSHIHIFSMCCYSMCQTAWSLRVFPPGSRAWPPLSDRFVLYCTVLYCTVLCCAVLFCSVLAATIRQVPGWAESFLRRDPAPAAAWLAATLPTELATFTDNFGHRCLKVMITVKRAFKDGDSI